MKNPKVPTETKWAANGMTTVYAPDGIAAGDIVAALSKKGIVIAGGLHKDIKSRWQLLIVPIQI